MVAKLYKTLRSSELDDPYALILLNCGIVLKVMSELPLLAYPEMSTQILDGLMSAAKNKSRLMLVELRSVGQKSGKQTPAGLILGTQMLLVLTVVHQCCLDQSLFI